METKETAPKEFKVGDRVKVVAVPPGCENTHMERYLGEIGTITEIDTAGWCRLSDCGYMWPPAWLEACEEAEAEAAPQELNLLELQTDGMEIYSPLFGYESISIEEKNELYPLSACGLTFMKDGRYINADQDDVHPILFPSRELYEKYPTDAHAAWKEWKTLRETTLSINCPGANFEAALSFGSIADVDACIEEIGEIIEKYCKE